MNITQPLKSIQIDWSKIAPDSYVRGIAALQALT